ncbi:uncharacterized protein LOC143275839 [Babylonia areolata]|uniref:uncharacterized protein LOC143275839 n=1 Tax=Babylonia areolata TaxID=304850 RepID=UPI003FD63532
MESKEMGGAKKTMSNSVAAPPPPATTTAAPASLNDSIPNDKLTSGSMANSLPGIGHTRSSPRGLPTSVGASTNANPPSFPSFRDAGLGMPLSPPKGVSGSEADGSSASLENNIGMGMNAARPSTHSSLPAQPDRPSSMATAKPQASMAKVNAEKLAPPHSRLGSNSTNNKVSPPDNNSLMMGHHHSMSRLENELMRGGTHPLPHHPQPTDAANFLSGNTSSSHSLATSVPAPPPAMAIANTTVDPSSLANELSFFLNDESNSPPSAPPAAAHPAIPSPTKQAPPPAPPGATVSAHGVGIYRGPGTAAPPSSSSSSLASAMEPAKPPPPKPAVPATQPMKTTKGRFEWSSSLNSANTGSSISTTAADAKQAFLNFSKMQKVKDEQMALHSAHAAHRQFMASKQKEQRSRPEKPKDREENESTNRTVNQRHSIPMTNPVEEIRMHIPPVLKSQEKVPLSREEQRRKEQEQRRREAKMQNAIDMNAQSELMANFEEMNFPLGGH